MECPICSDYVDSQGVCHTCQLRTVSQIEVEEFERFEREAWLEMDDAGDDSGMVDGYDVGWFDEYPEFDG